MYLKLRASRFKCLPSLAAVRVHLEMAGVNGKMLAVVLIFAQMDGAQARNAGILNTLDTDAPSSITLRTPGETMADVHAAAADALRVVFAIALATRRCSLGLCCQVSRMEDSRAVEQMAHDGKTALRAELAQWRQGSVVARASCNSDSFVAGVSVADPRDS